MYEQLVWCETMITIMLLTIIIIDVAQSVQGRLTLLWTVISSSATQRLVFSPLAVSQQHISLREHRPTKVFTAVGKECNNSPNS